MKFKAVTYDKENDVLYVQFSEADVVRTNALDDLRLVDYAADGTAVGIEFIGASEGIDLTEVPHDQQIPELLAAAKLKLPISRGDRSTKKSSKVV